MSQNAKEFLLKIINDHSAEKELCILNNKKYIDQFLHKNTQININFTSKIIYRSIIPKISVQPKYTHFIYFSDIMDGTNCDVLHYIPFVNNTIKTATLYDYKQTTLFLDPISYTTEIFERIKDKIFKKYPIENLKKYCVSENEINFDDEIVEIADFFGQKADAFISKLFKFKCSPIAQGIKEKQNVFLGDKSRLEFAFCNVCLIFGKCIHEEVKLYLRKK